MWRASPERARFDPAPEDPRDARCPPGWTPPEPGVPATHRSTGRAIAPQGLRIGPITRVRSNSTEVMTRLVTRRVPAEELMPARTAAGIRPTVHPIDASIATGMTAETTTQTPRPMVVVRSATKSMRTTRTRGDAAHADRTRRIITYPPRRLPDYRSTWRRVTSEIRGGPANRTPVRWPWNGRAHTLRGRSGCPPPPAPQARTIRAPREAGFHTLDVEALLAGLNPVQREAVEAPDGPLLIVAGAGSGKTRVLTHRIAYLIADPAGVAVRSPGDHLHQQGRGEMKERVAALVGPVAHRMWVSTFHSACVRILRREAGSACGPRSRSTTRATACAWSTTCAAT